MKGLIIEKKPINYIWIRMRNYTLRFLWYEDNSTNFYCKLKYFESFFEIRKIFYMVILVYILPSEITGSLVLLSTTHYEWELIF